jgi:HAMP domain-containing protein
LKNKLFHLLTGKLPAIGLRQELFLALALIGLLGVGIAGYLIFNETKKTLQKQISNQLINIRDSKAEQILLYFQSVENESKLLASSQLVIEASKNFLDGVKEINDSPQDSKVRDAVVDYYRNVWVPMLNKSSGEDNNPEDFIPVTKAAKILQYEYILNNPFKKHADRILYDAGPSKNIYNKAHAVFNPHFREFIKRYGFYDFFLVDPISGQIIYTSAKEVDFGTNLHTGPFKGSHLAQVVTKCIGIKSNEVCYADFAFYAASLGIPAGFIAVPVIDNGKLLTIMVLQLDSGAIDNIMTSNNHWQESGLGATGEVYLVGKDFLLRSNSRFFIEDRKGYYADLMKRNFPESLILEMERGNSSILLQSIFTDSVKNAFKNNSGVSIIKDYRDISVLSAYKKISIGSINYAIIAEIDESEAFQSIDGLRTTFIYIFGAIFLLIGMVAYLLTNHFLLKPIAALTVGANKMAEGDYSTNLPIDSHDELGELTKVFNKMCSKIQEQNQMIQQKNVENESLLLNILPAPIAERLKGGSTNIADSFANVTVLFADIVGFTRLASNLSATDLVKLLNELFMKFDNAALEYDIEKIKTIGDCYMAVCGMLNPAQDHTARMINLAVRMINICHEFSLKNNMDVKLRVGIHTGTVVAGVMGTNKFIYDVCSNTYTYILGSGNYASSSDDGLTVKQFKKLKIYFCNPRAYPINVIINNTVQFSIGL